jgi:hypothetical protein
LAVSKRSPILGYNHNVRYRGLVFHVQTEDSGILSPHLFTHLFHHGVIVSTRKLVYDAGATEEVIKSLMQAQHKAVLKDLRKGVFDEKIDQYLGGTPGLLPRGAKEAPAATPPPDDSGAVDDKTTPQPRLARPSEPEVEAPEPPTASPQQLAAAAATASKVPAPRAMTQERTSGPGSVRNNLDASVEAVTAAPTIRTPMPPDFSADLEPEIEIELELDDPNEDVRGRMPRDTTPSDTSRTLYDGGLPAAMQAQRMPGESIPPLPPPPDKRASTAVGAASLPPGRKISRPPARPAITPPQVVTRARPNESDAVEVYAPAPPSAEAPPGASSERPGQYAQHKKVSEKIPIKDLQPSKPALPAVPAGLGKPGRANQKSGPLPRTAAAASGGPPAPGTPRPRTPTPPRTSVGAGPAQRNNTPGGGGVVMTRPAVIVGAPTKSSTTTGPRVRKAREDEGRGFGQGLISEKSLDEVILAYLSEDSDDK